MFPQIRQDTLELQGVPLGSLSAGSPETLGGWENPQPFFRDSPGDLPVAQGQGFPKHKEPHFGRETGFRILPYTRQDRYSRELRDLALPSIIMENDFLKARFIPALGGRLWSLFDKRRRRDILYRNPVLRPANLAIREAWFSGGIEWNIGRLGHTVHTCAPVFAGIVEADQLPILRIWEFERQTRLFWRVECILPEHSPVLYVYVRIENPDPIGKPLYWWTNAAVPQTKGVRVLSNTDEVLYMVPGPGQTKTIGGARLPNLPTLPGVDGTYPVGSYYSNEYFFQNDGALDPGGGVFPWEAAVYEDGYAYVEAATPPLVYRKMFCWGTGRGGRRWQDFLSLPGEEYLEVQAGLAPTQLHTSDIGGNGMVDWVQGFTALTTDPQGSHHRDYRAASKYLGDCIAASMSPADLNRTLQAARNRGETPVREVIHLGSGWAALEQQLQGTGQGSMIPPGLSFPGASIGDDEKPWAALLQSGNLPLRSPAAGPGSFVVHEGWELRLITSLGREGDWLSPYHLGVISFERGEYQRAISWWKDSCRAQENPWALRNLGLAALREGNIEAGLGYYKKAFDRPEGKLDPSFAEEYIPLLIEQGRIDEAALELQAYKERGYGLLSQPLLDAAARIAFARRDDRALDTLFSSEPAHIREGDTTLVSLWTAREVRRLVEQEGLTETEGEARIQEALALGLLEPPREIDFRMYIPGRFQGSHQ